MTVGYRVLAAARMAGRDLVFLARSLHHRARPGWSTQPVVLCNSYPKSGTHLLYQILAAVPGLSRWPDNVSVLSFSGFASTATHLERKLACVPPGGIARAHLYHCPEVLAILRRRRWARLFIYRDLRDVALSHARWVMSEPRSYLHRYYRYVLANDDDRLLASIVGIPIGTPLGSNATHPAIAQNFPRWRGWLTDPDTLSLRFEDLVGARGGGSDEARERGVRRVLAHLGVALPESAVAELFSTSALDPRRTGTFRSGRIGGWREAFREEHKQAFKRTAGPLLVELGYERDESW